MSLELLEEKVIPSVAELFSSYIENGLSEDEKVAMITHHFGKILEILGLDMEDDSLSKTPHRYAKMMVEELFSGLKRENFPPITTQENRFSYHEMVLQTNITIKSICEHHFVPILGCCHIAYYPKNRVIGLSKLSRVAQYFAKRPQLQERMTKQIRSALSSILETEDVAVVVDGVHFCMRLRGVEDEDALVRTVDFGGCFLQAEARREFLSAIPTLQGLRI